MKTISLFSGCGGLDWGFKQAGFNIIWANDILKDACESYKKNIGNHIVNGDILEIDPLDIPKADLIIGGPPCQGFSGIGKRDPNDKRSDLVWDFLSIIEIIKPSLFLFENVTGIKSSRAPDGSKVLNNLLEAFRNLGFSTNVFTLNAADYGVPQRRKRVFIIGNNKGFDIESPSKTHSETNLKLKKWVSSEEALGDLCPPNDEGVVGYKKDPDNDFLKVVRRKSNKKTDLHITPYASQKDMEIIRCVKPGGNYMDVPDSIATKRILYFKKTGGRTTTYGRLDPTKPAYTLNTYFDRPNIGCNIHYNYDRMITIREGMRLQSFPDDFKIYSSNKRNYYVQIGNAVPPLLSLTLAKHLYKIFTPRSV